MSIDKALAKEGLQLQGDSLPKEQRNVKTFKRLIAAIRACEASVQDDLSIAQRQLNDVLRENSELRERLYSMEQHARKQRVSEALNGIESIPVSEKTKLLEIAS